MSTRQEVGSATAAMCPRRGPRALGVLHVFDDGAVEWWSHKRDRDGVPDIADFQAEHLAYARVTSDGRITLARGWHLAFADKATATAFTQVCQQVFLSAPGTSSVSRATAPTGTGLGDVREWSPPPPTAIPVPPPTMSADHDGRLPEVYCVPPTAPGAVRTAVRAFVAIALAPIGPLRPDAEAVLLVMLEQSLLGAPYTRADLHADLDYARRLDPAAEQAYLVPLRWALTPYQQSCLFGQISALTQQLAWISRPEAQTDTAWMDPLVRLAVFLDLSPQESIDLIERYSTPG